ncbi:MAG: hypothetical protein HY900_28305 [Deltaproteobacteria bacterium]|nr:hypothetical protein [Deltaproteobacteria bacterium]
MRRRAVAHGTLAAAGYLLSPLSWWNDLFVNVPLAYVFASLVALLLPRAFGSALVVGYWATNVVGLVLLHRGAVGLVCATPPCAYSRRMLLKDLGISLLYTAAVALLAWTGVLAPPQELLSRRGG